MIVVLPDTCQKTNFSKLARIPSIDVFGTDPYWLILKKDLGFVREYAQLIKEVTKKPGKRSQLWIQNFFVPKNKEKELEEAFEIIIDAKPDQFCFFYYWRNNDDPERIWKITEKYLKRI